MTELMCIGEYVHKTAQIIASVINEEVVICDEEGRLIGDSKLLENQNAFINRESILLEAMRKKQMLLKESIKTTVDSCANCKMVDICDINSIIALPLLKKGRILGCIGVYSKEKCLDCYSGERSRFLIEFTSQMSELILSKLSENRENRELSLMKEQLKDIIENLNEAVVCIGKEFQITHANEAFRKMFGLKEGLPKTITEIEELSDCPDFRSWISKEESAGEKEFQVGHGRKRRELYSRKKTVGTSEGNIIYFRNSEDYYAEINHVSNNGMLFSADDIIGVSDSITGLKKQIGMVAKSPSTVLIQGESGTGKEIFSRAIHNAGTRSGGPFITVNCAAIPDNLIESELFGYEEGAFTGAVKGGRIGKFQLANKGTLFLDEVGEIPIHLQAKLLRAIQEKKIQKLGAGRDIDIDIRIIAATNRNLEAMMKSGEFREDLYYRLNVIPVVIPPLRERKADIPVLLGYFIKKYNQVLGKNISGFSKKAMQYINSYDWPGNVRELQNMAEYCVNVASGKLIEEKELPAKIREMPSVLSSEEIRPLAQMEAYYIEQAVKLYGNDLAGKEKAAKALGIGIATLYRKLKK